MSLAGPPSPTAPAFPRAHPACRTVYTRGQRGLQGGVQRGVQGGVQEGCTYRRVQDVFSHFYAFTLPGFRLFDFS